MKSASRIFDQGSTSGAPNGNPQTGGESSASSSPVSGPPIKGHDGRFTKVNLDNALVHVDIADAASEVIREGGRIREIHVTADDPTRITLEKVFIGGGAHPALYDHASRTIKTPWTVILHEAHKGHGIKIVASSRRSAKSNITVSTLHRDDYFDVNPVGDGITMYSLHDDMAKGTHDRELKSISVESAHENVEYKCDTAEAGKSKSGIQIGVWK